MSKTISLTIPYTAAASTAAATMFKQLADGLGEPSAPNVEPTPQPIHPDPAVTSVVTEAPAPEPSAAEVFQTITAGQPAPMPNNVIPMDPAGTQPDQTVTAVINPEETELDSAGLPWDGRIHAKTKTKDVKGNWKLLRGIDRVNFLPQIEAELRAGIAGAPAAPVATPEQPAPAAAVGPSKSVTTFAQLITTVTANGISQEQVDGALAAVGVANIALLGAQPDLVPVVAGHLGL